MIKQILVSSCVLFSATFVVQAQNPKLGVSPIQDVINAMTLDEKIQLVERCLMVSLSFLGNHIRWISVPSEANRWMRLRVFDSLSTKYFFQATGSTTSDGISAFKTSFMSFSIALYGE